jgi:hypothetical protein
MMEMWPQALRAIVARPAPLRAAARTAGAADVPHGIKGNRSEQAAAPPWRQRRVQTGAATVGLAALIAYLALTPLPPFATDVFGSLVRRHVILSAVLLGYAAWCVVRRRLPDPTPLDLPPAALAAALLIAAFRSESPRVGLETLLPLA